MREINYNTVLTKFKKHVRLNYDTRLQAALHYGVVPSHLSEILLQRRDKVMTEAMLNEIGYTWAKKAVAYKKTVDAVRIIKVVTKK